MSKHWSNEDLIDRLYGIGPDNSHLDECEDCRARWLQVQARRSIVLEPPEVPRELLLAQQRAIRDRIESGHRGSWTFRLAPVMAAFCVVVLGLVLSGPAPPPEPSLAVNDQFYSEIYSMVESEPWVAEPMYGLFEND
jgi:hypothetical protein